MGRSHRHAIAIRTDQFPLGDWASLRKFARPVTAVGFPANGCQNPLPDIADEVEEKIADAVHRIVGAPPEVFVVQLVQAVLDGADVGDHPIPRFGHTRVCKIFVQRHRGYSFSLVELIPQKSQQFAFTLGDGRGRTRAT